MKTLKLMIAFVILCVSTLAIAQPDPKVMLESIANQIISELQKNQNHLKDNPNITYKIIEQVLLPDVDMDAMSHLVLGRTNWTNASPTEQQQFTQEFTRLLINTYASAFSNYTNETVKFYPIRGSYKEQRRIDIQSVVNRRNGPPIPVTYSLVLRGDAWKIYDFSVEGISLIQNFRSQFSNEINHNGISGLIKTLKQHNEKQNAGSSK